MNKKILALAVSGLFISTAAMAEDKSWEGFKIGIGIGGQISQSKDTTSASHNFTANNSYTTSSGSGSDAVTNGFGANAHSNLQNLTNTQLDSTASLTDHGTTPTFTDTQVGGSTPGGFVDGATNVYNRNYNVTETFTGSGFSSNDLSKSNVFGTIEAGYDWQINDKIVVGLNASYNLTSKNKTSGTGGGENSAGWTESYTYNTITNSTSCSGSCGGSSGGSTYTYNSGGNQNTGSPTSAYSNAGTQTSQVGVNSSVETGNSFDLGGRIGYLANKDTLLFLSGGASTIRAKQNMSYTSHATLDGSSALGAEGSTNSYNFTATQSDSDTRIGYYLGAGVETRLADNITAKLEYRYADYGTMTRSSNGTPTLTDGGGNTLEFYNSINGTMTLSHSSEITTQSIRAVVSYNF